MTKRRNILADFSSSISKKETPVATPAPIAVPESLPEAAAIEIPRKESAPASGGFHRITISLTAADLEVAENKRFEIAQKHRTLLDRSKLLKVALRALDSNHPNLEQWIAEIGDSDLRKSKKS